MEGWGRLIRPLGPGKQAVKFKRGLHSQKNEVSA